MNNFEIRKAIKNNRLFHYEIAEKIGISEYTLCKWLRDELTDDRKRLILSAIKDLSEGVKNE